MAPLPCPPARAPLALAREPSLREILASLGIENTGQERSRKRREARDRRRAAQNIAGPVGAPPAG